MNLLSTIAMLCSQNPLTLIRSMRDWQSFIRLHFIYSAIESGLLESLKTPSSREELIEKLHVQRPELLEAILEVGLSLGELSYKKGLYTVKGKRSLSAMGSQGDMFVAPIQASVTYYNSVYRNFADRLQGAPLGDYLEDIGDIVARFSMIAEPFIHSFVKNEIAEKEAVRILDIGCGSGIHLRSAAKANPNICGIGIDMDINVVEQARQNIDTWSLSDKFKVIAGDIRTPPDDISGTFDLITLYNILYYFQVEERPALFRSLRSMLSQGGVIAIVSNFRGKAGDIMSANLNLATSSMVGCTPLPNLDEITAQLEESGFINVRKTRFMPGSALYGIMST